MEPASWELGLSKETLSGRMGIRKVNTASARDISGDKSGGNALVFCLFPVVKSLYQCLPLA